MNENMTGKEEHGKGKKREKNDLSFLGKIRRPALSADNPEDR